MQSVAVRLIVEREREVQGFKSEPYYRVNAVFVLQGKDGSTAEVKAELSKRFSTHDEAVAFLKACEHAQFSVASVSKKPLKRTPAPPFTTSTLQQEAARKLGFSVSQTMMVAQRLYEAGQITYMRTDSVNLSTLALNTSHEEIVKQYGEQYSQKRQYHTHSKGAQEAHEAIRPTYMSNASIDGTLQERRLYELIWKRTAASQMADAVIDKTTVNIQIDANTLEEQGQIGNLCFVAQGEVVVFDGFMKVYHESTDDEERNNEGASHSLPAMSEGDALLRQSIVSTERFSQAPNRYTEASLVHKLEELGIGRPSTYAPTISTIQQREYVQKGDKKGEERTFVVDTLGNDGLVSEKRSEMAGADKGKLIPTDIGVVVNDFLMANFPDIMDYNFTARVEQEFDRIADGKENWNEGMREFYKNFEPEVEKVMNARSEHKAGERELGVDPTSGKPVFVKIGRFGPVAQIGSADDTEKPRFAQIPSDVSMSSITLDQALELFKLPRTLGQFEGTDVSVGAGRFGPYVCHNKKYVSIPKGENPLSITLQEAIQMILRKRKTEAQRHLKQFDEDPKLEVMNGRFGPYLVYNGKNYRLPKAYHEKATELTYDQCMDLIQNAPEPKVRRRKA